MCDDYSLIEDLQIELDSYISSYNELYDENKKLKEENEFLKNKLLKYITE